MNAPGPGDPNTTVTFAVTSGALSMTAPATANLGSGAPGTTISGELGAVTVTDDRAALERRLDRDRVGDRLHHRRRHAD